MKPNALIARRNAQQGFTLVELLVAMLLALFLIGGLLTLEGSTRKTFGNQSQLSQLQDDERLAMTLIAEVVESGGYFPNPTFTTLNNALPATGVYVNAGQAVYGTHTSATTPDTLYVRYVTGGATDGMINCSGGSGTAGTFINEFAIDANNELTCSINGGNAIALVGGRTVQGVGGTNPAGVTNMQILYGVKTNFAVTNTSADSYLTAAQMTAADWLNVISVQVTLTFSNPLYGQVGQTAPTISFTRTICVMSKAGVNT
jgi:type IV pilus assembly protein PilW